MADHALLFKALRRFAVVMGGSYDIDEVSIQLGELLTETLGAAGAGVSVVDEWDRLKFVTATSEQIVGIEEVQERLQQGPCVAAFRTQEPFALGDIESAAEWPGYQEAALGLGLHAVVGYPLSYDSTRLGALNLYAAERREWTDDDFDLIGVFADMATAYLIRNAELAETKDVTRQLQGALDSRVIIEQAKGVLANQHRITADEAFELLRHYSQDNNLKLAQVSAAVVEGHLTFPDNALS